MWGREGAAGGGSWHLGSRGKGLGEPRIPSQPRRLLVPELWVLETWGRRAEAPRGRAAVAPGPGDPAGERGLHRPAAAWEEGFCPWDELGYTSEHTRLHSVCACMCACVGVHTLSTWRILALSKSADNVCLTGVTCDP